MWIFKLQLDIRSFEKRILTSIMCKGKWEICSKINQFITISTVCSCLLSFLPNKIEDVIWAKLVSQVLTKKWKVGAEGRQGVTLQNGDGPQLKSRHKIIGKHWLVCCKNLTESFWQTVWDHPPVHHSHSLEVRSFTRPDTAIQAHHITQKR